MKLTYAEHTILEAIHQDITANFLKTMRIKDICVKYSISETKLTQGFRAKYGLTIYGYYLQLKMNYAKGELQKGSAVQDLAKALNYSDVPAFIRAFKKVFAKSPGAYKFGGE